MQFPNESKAYRAARNDLLKAEIDLRRRIEKVAALRRSLPAGGEVAEDYVFDSERGKRILAYARERGWLNFRLLSSAGNNYNRDYHGETADGSQMPMLNVFVKNGGKLRHFFGTELLYAREEKGQNARHVDLIWPLWNLLDFTPEGRGADWYPKLSY